MVLSCIDFVVVAIWRNNFTDSYLKDCYRIAIENLIFLPPGFFDNNPLNLIITEKDYFSYTMQCIGRTIIILAHYNGRSIVKLIQNWFIVGQIET